VQDAVFAVNELATNSVEHGPGHGILRLWSGDTGFVCEVVGPAPIGPSLLGLVPPTNDQRRGRGLWMARRLCDHVHVWTDSYGTWARLRIDPAGA
jgi:anti-sigma regulatory factor (Ser/Thr protein kinase)